MRGKQVILPASVSSRMLRGPHLQKGSDLTKLEIKSLSRCICPIIGLSQHKHPIFYRFDIPDNCSNEAFTSPEHKRIPNARRTNDLGRKLMLNRPSPRNGELSAGRETERPCVLMSIFRRCKRCLTRGVIRT